MRVFRNLCLVAAGLSVVNVSSSAQQYRGTLSTELTLQGSYGHVDIKRTSKIPPGLRVEQGSAVYAGSFALSFDDEAHTQMRVLVVNPANGTPYLFLDNKHGGAFDENARLALTLDTEHEDGDSGPNDEIDYSGQTSLPIPIGMYKTYPIKLTVVLPNTTAKQPKSGAKRAPSSILLLSATSVSVNGTLDLNGKPIRVSYTLDVASKKVDPYKGQLGMDCNMDGKIDHSYTSPEQADANGGPVVFRVGSHYIATTVVDVATGTITGEERPAAEYRRIELVDGSQFSDFDFNDFEGKAHKLSDLRGKYVILDTWGTWCGSCLKEMKWMKEILYPRFHSRGLEILSLDVEHPGGRELPKRDLLKKGRKEAADYIRRKDIPWLQADEESVYDMIMNRLMVQRFPTMIVLDREGKIIGLDWKEEEMERKFAELLPESGHGGL